MMSLTTTQRDLLLMLLGASSPVSAVSIGRQLHLTPRQVHYGLRDIEAWLVRHSAGLRQVPSVGVEVACSAEQRQRLLAALASLPKFQLILTPEQRHQLLALQLLAARSPIILQQLQQDLAVARATVLKDLEAVETWLHAFDLQIVRRQHRGCWVDGPELAKRQALAALLWGDVPFDQPIMSVRQGRVVFALAQDSALLPIVGVADALVRALKFQAAHEYVARAESELGGRFTDQAVAQLELAFAVHLQRVAGGHHIGCDRETLRWAQSQTVWPVASRIAEELWADLGHDARLAETTAITLQLLSGMRDEPWRNDLGADASYHALIDRLLASAAAAYRVPELAHDQLLREGLEAHILPACVRRRFSLWAPPRAGSDTHAERYAAEREVAQQLADDIAAHTGMALPPEDLDDLILLLRAARIRARPERVRRVLVVCPSGMATTQLLVARLRARFPRMGTFEVLSTRELSAERIAAADLIISTVPLALPSPARVEVIQVHPMLQAEDVVALTEWMA